MNILLLSAGSDESFKSAGYRYSKNLAEIDGLPLIQRVLESLNPLINQSHNELTVILRKDENSTWYTGHAAQLLAPKAKIVEVTGVTRGAACSALLAIDQINNDTPLVIINGDQILDVDLSHIISKFQGPVDGGIIVFEAVHPRWSYVRCDPSGFVIEAAEKKPISRLATAGVYYFRSGKDFVSSTMSMIKKDAHVDGAFYVCPTYNEMILNQKKITVEKILRSAYHSLANPQGVQDYESFLRNSAGSR